MAPELLVRPRVQVSVRKIFGHSSLHDEIDIFCEADEVEAAGERILKAAREVKAEYSRPTGAAKQEHSR